MRCVRAKVAGPGAKSRLASTDDENDDHHHRHMPGLLMTTLRLPQNPDRRETCQPARRRALCSATSSGRR